MISRTAAASPCEPGVVETQAVLQPGAQSVLAAVRQVELVGGQDAGGAALDGERDRLEARRPSARMPWSPARSTRGGRRPACRRGRGRDGQRSRTWPDSTGAAARLGLIGVHIARARPPRTAGAAPVADARGRRVRAGVDDRRDLDAGVPDPAAAHRARAHARPGRAARRRAERRTGAAPWSPGAPRPTAGASGGSW